jgi:2-polyprenyl-6-methoxyphenol hydroxylase-like FAD-dependent oxidoreductase
VFGDEAGITRFIGGYLAVASAPKSLASEGEMIIHAGVGRMAGIYSADHLDDSRVLFMFRSKTELDYHYRDTVQQKQLLRDALAGLSAEADRWLAEIDATPSFYFDSISQLQLDIWSKNRVTLVGDAAYCPGPAVGGSTSLAVIGAYVLAHELIAARGDHLRAFAAYQHEMAANVHQSRVFARGAARAVVPGSKAAVWTITRGAQLISSLPAPLTRAIAKLNTKGVRMHDSMPVPEYPEIEPQ